VSYSEGIVIHDFMTVIILWKTPVDVILWQRISHMLVALLLFLARFFESKPKTTSSDELGKEKNGSAGKNSPEQDSSLGSGDR